MVNAIYSALINTVKCSYWPFINKDLHRQTYPCLFEGADVYMRGIQRSNIFINISFPINIWLLYQGFPDMDFTLFITGLGSKSALKTPDAMYGKKLHNGEMQSASVTMVGAAAR